MQAACHCIQCQKHTQSAFSLVGIVEQAQFQLISGTLKSWQKVAESGNRVDCKFCPECGNRIYHQSDNLPGILRLKLGTLEDTSVIQPRVHVWTQHKQRWLDLPEGIPSHPKQPDLAVLFRDDSGI
jgi:hypothetical protein